MTSDINADAGHAGSLVLDARLDLAGAQALKHTLLAHVGRAQPVRLEGSAVARVSTAACQVIAAFAIARKAQGRETRLVGPSDKLVQALAALGLKDLVA